MHAAFKAILFVRKAQFPRFRANQLAVSENRGTPKSSILIGFSIINHPVWGTSILETPNYDSIGKSQLKLQILVDPKLQQIHEWEVRLSGGREQSGGL